MLFAWYTLKENCCTTRVNAKGSTHQPYKGKLDGGVMKPSLQMLRLLSGSY